MAVKCILTGQTPSVLDGVTENVQTQINAKAADSAVVHLAEDETISGAKIFTGKVVMNSSDNVGIGTTAPSEKLEVTGNIKATKFKGDGSELTNIPYPVTKVAGKTGAVTLAKGDVGLGNVDNTSDANKPISNATQAALNGKQAKITASGLLKGDGAGNVSGATPGTDYVASPEIFWATYDTTTFAEIQAAYNAGKICICKQDDKFAHLTKITSTLACFTCVLSSSTAGVWYVNAGDLWMEQSEGYSPKTHASTHASGGADPITPASIGAAAKSSFVNATLSADSWSGDSTPYTYTLAVNGVTANSNQELLPALTITEEQLTALQAANIQDGGQAANSITLTAFGDKPAIDLPIRVIVRGDS